MDHSGDEAVFETREAALPIAELDVLRDENDKLHEDIRKLERANNENGLYIKDLEGSNAEYQETIKIHEQDSEASRAKIARLESHIENYEAEIKGVHAESERANAKNAQLEEELAVIKKTAASDQQTLTKIKPMLQDFFSENLQRIDELYDTRVSRDDAEVEVTALEGDLRASDAHNHHIEELANHVDHLIAERGVIRRRLEIVEQHFPGTAGMEPEELNDFLTDFREEHSPPPIPETSVASRKPRGSRGSKGPRGPRDHGRRSRNHRKDTRSVSLADELAGLDDGAEAEDEVVAEKPETIPPVTAAASVPPSGGSAEPPVEEAAPGKPSGEPAKPPTATAEPEALPDDTVKPPVTATASETTSGEAMKLPVATAEGTADCQAPSVPKSTHPRTFVVAMRDAKKWWLGLLLAMAALVVFLAGYWYGDYRWSHVNGYAPQDRYFHVGRGLLATVVGGFLGSVLWFLEFFCDPIRLFESWAQTTYADISMPG